MEEPTINKPKSEKDAWKEFMPDENFVPEWKKQIDALDKEQARKKLADRGVFATVGFGVATLLSLVPESTTVRLVILAVLASIAAWGWITSVLNKLKAVELDNKLNEDIRIEPLAKTAPVTLKPDPITEQKA